GGTASPGSLFQASVSCNLGYGNVTGILPAGPQSIGASGSLTFTNIPVGAVCSAQIANYPPAPAGYIWSAPAYSPGSIVIGPGTNRIDATSSLKQLVSLTVN